MVYYARDGSGPYYEAQVGVIPGSANILAVTNSSEDPGPGYTGEVTCGVRVWLGYVQVGTRSFESGVMVNEEIVWTNLYPLTDLDRGVPGISQLSYYKELEFSGDVLSGSKVYDSPAKSTLFITTTFTYTSGRLTRKTVQDNFNALTFAFDYTYDGERLLGKRLSLI